MRNLLNAQRVLNFLLLILTFPILFSCDNDSAGEMPYFGGDYEGEIILNSVATPWDGDPVVVNELKKEIKVRVDGKYIHIKEFPAGEIYSFYHTPDTDTPLTWTADYKIPYHHGGEKRGVEEIFLNPDKFEMKVKNSQGKKAELGIAFRDNHKCYYSGNSLDLILWLYTIYISGEVVTDLGRPDLSMEIKLTPVKE